MTRSKLCLHNKFSRTFEPEAMREDDTAEAISKRNDKLRAILARFHARAYTDEKTDNVISEERRRGTYSMI